MNLKQMEYFVRVIEAGSISRAAVLVNIAQPALSRQIHKLEQELGVQLLRRNGRGITATEHGERLLNECRGILRQVERIHEQIAHPRGMATSRFTIGMPSSVCAYLGVPLVRRLRKKYPDLKLQIVQGRSAALKDALVSGRLDMAVLYGVSTLTSVEKISLCEDELVLVRAAGHIAPQAISAQELAEVPLIVRLHPNLVRSAVETLLARHGLQICIDMEIDSINTIIGLAGNGTGNTVLSRRLVSSLQSSRALQVSAITDGDSPKLSLVLHAVIPARRPSEQSELVSRLLSEIRRALDDRGVWAGSYAATTAENIK